MSDYREDTTYHCRQCEPDYFPPVYPVSEGHLRASNPLDRHACVYRADGTQEEWCYEVIAGDPGVAYLGKPLPLTLKDMTYYCERHPGEVLVRRIVGYWRVERPAAGLGARRESSVAC